MNTACRMMLVSALALSSAALAAGDGFTKHFPLATCQFTSTGGNAYFPLKPGRQTYFSNAACVAAGDCDVLDEVWATTKFEVKHIALPIGNGTRDVVARVVEEFETENGVLTEISRNYFAVCQPTRDVYYFGEDVDVYENGKVVGHDGAWLTGRNGALPGIALPEDTFMVGQRYYQEVAPGVALDRAEHKRSAFAVKVPAGRFDYCASVEETTPLEPDDISNKVYCRDIGMVKDDDLELISVSGD